MKTTLEMAQKAGFWKEHSTTYMCSVDDIKAFEALVRADQREIDAKVCETNAPTTTPTWVSYAAAIRARNTQ